MKRFYKDVAVRAGAEGHEIVLDGRPVRTPAREPLLLPTLALAEAVAAEWEGQGDQVDPRTMPLTGLANAAIDRVAKDRAAFAAGLARYGEGDLLCYRAEGPDSLIARQDAAWTPLLDWARRRFDVDFTLICGIMHNAQPDGTVERLSAAVDSRNPFELAGLSPLVTISGSLVIALALAEGAADLDTAWAAASLDEAWQAEQWGEDAEARAALDARRHDFEAAHRFLTLL
ncbi:ATP12 family chaperone protein [Allosphingosinicella vermicomposti]|uniref:ATP12 family chaperone protein n=1 Tax=Allosphingosinicella vermicomposti TaxID=614671 RepID=UPI000D1073B7|nr:ATP12 family protein [Allosphingosinicella vermicomposti]